MPKCMQAITLGPSKSRHGMSSIKPSDVKPLSTRQRLRPKQRKLPPPPLGPLLQMQTPASLVKVVWHLARERVLPSANCHGRKRLYMAQRFPSRRTSTRVQIPCVPLATSSCAVDLRRRYKRIAKNLFRTRAVSSHGRRKARRTVRDPISVVDETQSFIQLRSICTHGRRKASRMLQRMALVVRAKKGPNRVCGGESDSYLVRSTHTALSC